MSTPSASNTSTISGTPTAKVYTPSSVLELPWQSLSKLTLIHTSIIDWGPLKHFRSVTDLDISYNTIDDADALLDFASDRLLRLVLGECVVENGASATDFWLAEMLQQRAPNLRVVQYSSVEATIWAAGVEAAPWEVPDHLDNSRLSLDLALSRTESVTEDLGFVIKCTIAEVKDAARERAMWLAVENLTHATTAVLTEGPLRRAWTDARARYILEVAGWKRFDNTLVRNGEVPIHGAYKALSSFAIRQRLETEARCKDVLRDLCVR